MKLDSLSIKGFRSISELGHLKIGTPTMLTGHNDAGKSAILDAVRFLLNDYSLTERDPTYAISSEEPREDSSLVVNRVTETYVEGTFTLSRDESSTLNCPSSILLRRISQEGISAIYEIMSSLPDNVLLREYRNLSVTELKTRVRELNLTPAGQTKLFLIAALDIAAASAVSTPSWQQAPATVIKALPRIERFNHSSSSDAEEAIRSALQIAYKAHSDDETLRGNIRELENSLETRLVADADAMRDHIMYRCSDIGSVRILPTVSFTSGFKSAHISVTAKDGEDVHLGEAGAGRARRVSLAVWEFNTGFLAGVGDVVMLYDEPDIHLDYAHQRDFMQLVRLQCDLPNVRMVIATHSMNLIDGVDIAGVIHVKHVDNRTIIDQLEDGSEVGRHLGAIATSLGLRNTVLLNERLFVGVEGDTEAAAIPVLFRLATGRQLESCGIALWPCRNNEGAMDFASFLVHHSRTVVFLVDADSKHKTKHVFSEAKLRQRGLDPDKDAIYLGDPNELEDLFSDDLWASVANSKWPRVDGSAWTISQISALRSLKFSKELLTLFKEGSDNGPGSKPEMMTTLALHISDGEVPETLRLVFEDLINRAN